jgi:hypothetical protein
MYASPNGNTERHSTGSKNRILFEVLPAEGNNCNHSKCDPIDGKRFLRSTAIVVTKIQITVTGNIRKFILDV